MKKYSKFLAILLAVAMILPGFGQLALADGEVEVKRLAGDNAVATAIAVSKEAYNEADTVVIAGRVGSADALTGSLLAKTKNAPLLIAGKGKDDNTAKVVAEIERLKAKNVIILGGEEAVAPAVKAELEAIAGVTVKRIEGSNRYETAAKLAEEATNTEDVFLALGRAADNGALADALAIGPVSAQKGMPVLLTRTDKLPAETVKALKDLGVKNVTIVGGEVAISAEVKAELEALGLTVDRIAGANRYATSVEIAKKYFAKPDNLLLANGKVDFDALVGGYFGAKLNAPILLTRDNKLADELKDYMTDNKLDTYILGGTSVVKAEVADEVVEILDGKEEGELKVISVSAINPTRILVEFNQDVPAENAEVANFSVSEGTLEAVNVSGKTATLSMKGLSYGQSIEVSVVEPAHTATVVIPEVSDLYKLEISTDAEGDTIKSNGASKMQVQVILKDKLTGEIVEKDGLVDFTATRGGLGQERSALQNGKAYVQLTSVASPTSVTSTVTAVLAEVPGSEEFEGLSGQKSVFFTPDGEADKVEFVKPLEAESTQGDRFFVQFSGPIKAADYIKQIEKDNPLVTTKSGLAKLYGVQINTNNATPAVAQDVAISDVRNVTEDTLEFILDVDQAPGYDRIQQPWTSTNNNNYLRDNVKHTVYFPNKIGRLILDETDGIDFILTDTSRPAVLGVTAKDQLEFTVRFTETVDRQTVLEENFLIDGKGIEVIPTPTGAQIAAAKAANKIIVTDLTVGTYWKNNTLDNNEVLDQRNLVTFKLHRDFALVDGEHQIQVANVGDYAQDVDPAQNKVVTDTFDFNVTEDKSVPEPTITVQSPEQWRIDFDKPVYSTGNKTVKDIFSVKSADSNDTFEMGGPGTYPAAGVDYVVSSIDKTGTVGGVLNTGANLNGEQYFLIEFTNDWTQKYDTDNNPLKTYFASTKNPYTVTIENVESAIGNKMSKKELNVNLSYDGVSPEIADAYQEKDTNGNLINSVRVEMTEPVKNVYPNDEGLTESQQQANSAGVPVPTYEFVKGDKVIEGQLKTGSESHDDYRFSLEPKKTLDPGTWTLYIRSISDDIGNTSATVSRELVIAETVADVTDTQIAWAAFDDADGTGKLVFEPAKFDTPNNHDVLYVKFTTVMKPGGAKGVDRTQNYVFMGQPLPGGSQVHRGIKGVTKDWDGVTITMPKTAWDGVNQDQEDFTVALNIADNFESANGEKLSGAYEIELFDTATDGNTATGLDDAFEAVYLGAVQTTFGGEVAIKGAEGQDTNGNGKIDTVVLENDVENAIATTPTKDIFVNGKTFVYSTSAGTTITYTAATGEEIAGTTTDGLKITTANGSIIVNTSEVEDEAGPQVISAKASNLSGGNLQDDSKIVVEFSEAIDLVKLATIVADINDITATELDTLLGASSDKDYSTNGATDKFVDFGDTKAAINSAGTAITITIKDVTGGTIDVNHFIIAKTLANFVDLANNQATDLSTSTDLTGATSGQLGNNVQVK